MKTAFLTTCFGLALTAVLCPGGARAKTEVLILLDASASMGWQSGLVQGRTRMSWVREGVPALLENQPKVAQVGLRVFGHVDDCTATDLLVPIAEGTDEELLAALDQVAPTGPTPLALALRAAIDDFSTDEGPKQIVLLSDGVDTCRGGDVCAVVEEIRSRGIDVQIDVVGIVLNEDAVEELSCLPEETGGTFVNLTESDLPNLNDVLAQVGGFLGGLLWRLVALLLGILAILTWTRLVYFALATRGSRQRGLLGLSLSLLAVALAGLLAAHLFASLLPVPQGFAFAAMVILGTTAAFSALLSLNSGGRKARPPVEVVR